MKINIIATNILYICLSSVVIVGLFYWFQWRPAEIRKECYEQSERLYFAYRAFEKEIRGLERYSRLPDEVELKYKSGREQDYINCLRKNGLGADHE